MMAPLLKRRRVLAAKQETVIGTAEVLAAAEAAFNIYDLEIQPDIPFQERPGQGALSSLPGVTGARSGKATFWTELYADTGPPAWATTLLPACGLIDTADVFSPSSLPPGAGGSTTKTVTLGGYCDGVKKALAGCMGNVKFVFVDGETIRVEFEFVGKWIAPTDVALLAPTYPTIAPLRFFGDTITLAGAGIPPLQQIEIDLGNDVQLREDAADATGYHSAVIVARALKGTMNPEAALLATWNPFTLLTAHTEQALIVDLTSVKLTVPKLQIVNVQAADRNGLDVHQVDWQGNRSAAAGDDELSIDFSPA